MSGEKLSLEQFSALLKNIDSGLGPAASQLWKEGVNTEALLRKLTKQDMHEAGINLGSRVLIYDHFHPTDADTPSLSISEVIRLKHVAKVFIHDDGSSPISTVSEEIRYKHIAQSAISDMTLVSDPHILEPFASTSSINDCPDDFATIDITDEVKKDPELKNDSLAKENDVHILQLHQALANALGATVGVVNRCSTFEVNSRNVVNSHNIETIGHLKPDIVVLDKRLLPGALSVMTFVEVLTGSIEDAPHVGKMIVYLRQLLKRHPDRTHVYGALTNLQTAALYHCDRARDTIQRSPAVYMGQGGFSLLINLLRAPSDVLGYAAPNLNLSSMYSPVCVLGQGHNSTVYEAIANAQHFAVKVFDVSRQGADKAFKLEKAVLEALMASQKKEAEGAKILPRLITTSTNTVGVSAASIVTQPVASPISAGKLDEVFLKGYLAGLRCLHGLNYVHGDIEPRHLCISASGSPSIIDLGEARALDINSNSPRAAWAYRGTVRYASTDILHTLSAPVGDDLGSLELQREAKHDLVALVKSFWAIRFGKVAQLNTIEASDIQAIEKFWADVLDDTIVAKNYKQAMQHAENSNYGAVWLALGNVCATLDKQT